MLNQLVQERDSMMNESYISEADRSIRKEQINDRINRLRERLNKNDQWSKEELKVEAIEEEEKEDCKQVDNEFIENK